MIISIVEINDFYELYNKSCGGALKNLDIIKNLIESEKITKDNSYYNFERYVLDYLNDLIQECYEGHIDQTELNDLLWFDDDFILDLCNNVLSGTPQEKYFNSYDELYDYYTKKD